MITGYSKNPEYAKLLRNIKKRVQAARYEPSASVSKELIGLYWNIGQAIVESRKGESRSKIVVEQLAKDLQIEFPGILGFSAGDIWYMRSFYIGYNRKRKL